MNVFDRITQKSSVYTSRGFTLIEALVSAFIVSTVVLGPLTVAIDASSNARLTKDTITSAYIAQEGVELLRMLQDSVYLKCTQGSAICPVSSNQTTSDAAWSIFKGYIGHGLHSVSASCYKSDGAGCTFDFIGMTENITNGTDVSPTIYSTTDSACALLAFTANGMYVCMGVHGALPGTQAGKFIRRVYVESLQTTPGPDAGFNDDLRVTSMVTFVRPFGTTKTVTFIDFLHARS
jgi:Tfp pilus assembly protein PilV